MSSLPLFTIYAHPKDYEIGYVAREWTVESDGTMTCGQSFRAPSLQAARAVLPPGLFRIVRDSEDDPCIVETWV